MAESGSGTDLLQLAKEEAARCNRCGYCQAVCPTYLVTGVETNVARGRNNLVRAAGEGETGLTKTWQSTVFECLLCGACTTTCFPAVRTAEVMALARAAVREAKGQPALQRYVFRELLPDRKKMDKIVKLARLGKRSGVSGLVQALRVVGWYGRNLAEAERILTSVPDRFLRERLDEVELTPEDRPADVAYFTGCAMNYALPDVGLSTLRVLTGAGLKVTAPDNNCCGLPAYAYGDLQAAKQLAKRNIEVLEATRARWITSDCASCTSFLSDYPKLFVDEPEWRERAERLKSRIRDATQILAEIAPRKAQTDGLEVTYHDPCHLAHHLGEREAPREVLKNLQGVEYVELPEANVCCGGAGSYNVAHPDLSAPILERKMANVRSTEAKVLATACPACIIQLRYGARRYKVPVEVRHVSQLVEGGLREEPAIERAAAEESNAPE